MCDFHCTFLVVVVAVVVDIVSVSSIENVSASLQGSTSSPHCLQKHMHFALTFSFFHALFNNNSQGCRYTKNITITQF